MTLLSQLPWHTVQTPSGAVEIHDAAGKFVAVFNDYRDAEYALGTLQDDQLTEIKVELHDAEKRCEFLESEVADYKAKMTEIKKHVK